MAKVQDTQYVDSAQAVKSITFDDDMAAIEVPIEALDLLPLKNDARCDDPRYRAVLSRIRWQGYNNADPVIVRLGRRGRWVVVDGGHRLTAARQVDGEFFTNLYGRKVRSIYFLLYRTPLSETLLGQEAA